MTERQKQIPSAIIRQKAGISRQGGIVMPGKAKKPKLPDNTHWTKKSTVFVSLIMFIVAFGSLGAWMHEGSHAATPTAAVEAENGLVSSAASTVNDSSASGGQAVKFGSSSGSPTAYPGQPGNPVGYAAFGALGTTPWPGGSFASGTATNPTVYRGYSFSGTQTISGSYIEFISCDFNGGTGGAADVTGSHLTFTGDRFQSNATQYYNVMVANGASNITFSEDSFTPLASYYASPPGYTAWPSAGAGQNTYTQTEDVNSIKAAEAYEYGVNITNGGPVTLDHSDIWGFGNAVVFYATTAQMTVTDNWIHDAAYSPGSNGYHTDGPGYLNSGAGPSNVLIHHNTIATLGNTNGIAFQAATSGYNNIQISDNFVSGFGYTVALGAGSQHFTNSSFTGNVLGTDIESGYGPLYAGFWTDTGGNTWKCNTFEFRPGTSWTNSSGWTPSSSINGKYWLPGATSGSTTDYNGNTTCP